MVDDLSRQHQPVSDLFPPLPDKDQWDQYRLTQEQLEFFNKNGYVAGIRILSDEQVDALNEELARLADPGHPGHQFFYEFHTNEASDPSRVLFHALGAWRIEPGFHDLLWNPAFTIPASQLLGGPVRFWHDQLFCKPAQHGGVVAWHQDYSYWTDTKPLNHLTCWIGLDDSTTENGCLHYIPGSHRWELLPITGLADDMNAVEQVLNDEQKKMFDKRIPVELKKGECSFHHGLTMHGSYENNSDRSRRATVINAFLDGTVSDKDGMILEQTEVIPKGKPMDGQFFPLLLDV